MTYIQNITGEQMGSYFGYALAAGDIDQDGLDDLIVGAPMYTVPNNPEMTIETGTIYVFYARERYRNIKFDQRSVHFFQTLHNSKICMIPKYRTVFTNLIWQYVFSKCNSQIRIR